MIDESSAYKTKVAKLMIEFNAERLPDNDFINSFMPRVWEKCKIGRELSEKERAKIDELFEQH